MALTAGNVCVHAREWPICVNSMIEFRIQPIGCSVTRRTIVREIKLHVWWILAVVKVGCMARITSGWSALEDVVDVTGRAWQRGVCSGEGKACYAQVIELCVEPRVHGVAGLACGGETRRYMVQHRGLKILLMTAVASSR